MNNEYKRQIDSLCDEKITLTADDILNKAKQEQPEIKMTPSKKRFKPIVFVAAAAAGVMLLGGTAVAATGGWGSFIKTLFGDNTTAQIAEEGYISEFSQKKTDGAFSVALLAGTGDENFPKLIFDVTIEDKNIAASDKIFMTAYILSEEVYNNDLESYAPCDAYGYRDEEAAGLYHVMMDAPSGYFLNPTDIVVDVCGIYTYPDSDDEVFYETDIRFDFSSEDVKLMPAKTYYPDESHYEYNGITYELIRFTSGEYETELNFRFRFQGTEFAGGETDYYKLEQRLTDNWRDFSEQIVLTVDGKDYTAENADLHTIWYDEEGEASNGNFCYITAYIPYAGLRHATSAYLTIGDVRSHVLGAALPETTEKPAETTTTTTAPETTAPAQDTQSEEKTAAVTTAPDKDNNSEEKITTTAAATEEATTSAPAEAKPQETAYNKGKAPEIKLSGNSDDSFVAEEDCYILTENAVLYIESGSAVRGDLAECAEKKMADVSKTTGLDFKLKKRQTDDVQSILDLYYDSESFKGMNEDNSRVNLMIVTLEGAEIEWAGCNYAVLDDQDLYYDCETADVAHHELTHTVFLNNGADLGPTLNEGIATFFSEKNMEQQGAHTWSWIQYYDQFGFDDKCILDGADGFDHAFHYADDRSFHYVYGFTFCKFLEDTYGKDIFIKLLNAATADGFDASYSPDDEAGSLAEDTEHMKKIIISVTEKDVFEKFAEWYSAEWGNEKQEWKDYMTSIGEDVSFL